MRRFFYISGLLVFAALLTSITILIFADYTIKKSAAEFIYDIENLPQTEIAVVPGTSKFTIRGTRNLYYQYRLEAVAELYHNQSITYVLVSGDNREIYYDEPTTMMNDLIAMGIPRQVIYRDHAGFRTLDSVIRARDIFQADSFVFVSQPFHNERAIYIGRAHGIDIIGYNARDVSVRGGMRTRIRELFARLMAILDINLLDTNPYFSGPPIPIGEVPGN